MICIESKKKVDWFKFSRKVFEHKNRNNRYVHDKCLICQKKLREGTKVGHIIKRIGKNLATGLVEKKCYENSQNLK